MPIGIWLFDNDVILPPAGLPPYNHGEVVIRNNLIRSVDGIVEPGDLAISISISSAKKVLIEDNLLDAPAIGDRNHIEERHCGSVRCLNNRTSAGALIQGVNYDTKAKHSELEVEIEDAALLSI